MTWLMMDKIYYKNLEYPYNKYIEYVNHNF